MGYDWKEGNITPYIEGGAGFNTPDNGDTEDFTVLEVGTKVKLTDDLSAYIKGENYFFEDESKWKVEVGTKYRSDLNEKVYCCLLPFLLVACGGEERRPEIDVSEMRVQCEELSGFSGKSQIVPETGLVFVWRMR